MKTKSGILIVCLSIIFHGCCHKNSNGNIVDVDKLSDAVYCERYKCYGCGVFGGDIIYTYITDSVSFRKYVGKYDDYGMIYYSFLSDSVINAYNVTDIGKLEHQYDTMLIESYNLSSLKKTHSFDIPCEN